MRLLAWAERPDHVCCRYRLTAFAPRLASAGHSLDIAALPRSVWGRLTSGRRCRDYDAVVIQRKLLPDWQLALIRREAKRLIFDFDDAVWMRDSYSPKGLISLARLRRFRAAVEASDLVIAGNEYLAENARHWTDPGRVAVVPTCVDPSRYPDRASHPDLPPRLVWIGSASTLQGLERSRDIWDAVGRGNPGVRLKLICDRFIAFDCLPIDTSVWSARTEAAELASADVGVAWVPDDPWSRGKCGLKVLQYYAAGLPVIANPVGVQAEMVRDGETGFLAETPEEWAEAVCRLRDTDSRRRMGAAGRRLLETEYATEVGAGRWKRLLKHLSPAVPEPQTA